MTGFIKEIYSPNLTGEEAEYFTAIDRSCDRIIRTTDLIMNYSQLETGTYTFIPKQMELSSICMNLVSKYNVSAKSKSLSLLFENKIGRTVISADEYSITQVISNLIENAIIYTKMGFVTVKLYQNPQNEIMLDVIDSGIGIGGEYLSHIFESFRQEQMGYSRSYEGLGLGLALVKKILDLHNATISVESKKGEGTTFTINFGKSLQNIEELTAKKNIVPKVEVTSTKIDRIVLIVEDDIINQTIMKRYINKKYNTLVADSHDSVMENLVNNKVDLILMDISLQGSKNGLEITKELKASKEYKHIPIIAETAHAFESDQIAALEAGCDDYLTKPFSRDQLLEKIEKFVKAGDNL
jgi:CheY-like chemotaxis protein